MTHSIDPSPPPTTAGSSLAHPPFILDGTRTYHIEGIIGAGSFAHVYRARCVHNGLSRRVVLKVLNKPEYTARLWEEGRVMGLLTHHGIPRIEGRLFIHGHPTLVMEYVPSVPLSMFVEAKMRFPANVALEIVAQVASAVTELHELFDHDDTPTPLAHGDIKPDNIVLTPWGGVKLVDFGTVHAPASDVTDDIGTKRYLAPERLQGCVRIESDTYALGCVLCELITGKAPHPVDRYPSVPSLVYPQVSKLIAQSGCSDQDAIYELITWMLGDEEGYRPTAEEARAACRKLLLDIGPPNLFEWAIYRVQPLSPHRIAPLAGVTVREPLPITGVQQFQRWYLEKRARLLSWMGRQR